MKETLREVFDECGYADELRAGHWNEIHSWIDWVESLTIPSTQNSL